MQVKFLKAGTGDSILIHHNKRNILIDGGNESNILLEQIKDIFEKNEAVDLLVITHHDDDHIKGIIDLLRYVLSRKEEQKNQLIKQVIFNSPRLIYGKVSTKDETVLSYKQAYEVENLLVQIAPKWEIYTEESAPIIFDDLKLEFLSPTTEDLKTYGSDKGAYLTGDYKSDWNTPMSLLSDYINDDSQDKSLPNRSSIVINLECGDKSILLTGDVTPDRLECILNNLVAKNNDSPVPFNYIKLPHHGSYRSLNKNIIEKVACSHYIISTNSKRHYLPNKRTLLKILKYRTRAKEQIEFIFNYNQSIDNLRITDQEKKNFNFILTPNNEDYGFNIG